MSTHSLEFSGTGFDDFALVSESQPDGERQLADRLARDEAAQLLEARQSRLELGNTPKPLPDVEDMTCNELARELEAAGILELPCTGRGIRDASFAELSTHVRDLRRGNL